MGGTACGVQRLVQETLNSCLGTPAGRQRVTWPGTLLPWGCWFSLAVVFLWTSDCPVGWTRVTLAARRESDLGRLMSFLRTRSPLQEVEATPHVGTDQEGSPCRPRHPKSPPALLLHLGPNRDSRGGAAAPLPLPAAA